MPIAMSSDRAVCAKCGKEYSRRKGYFPVSYAALYKGLGYIPICGSCIESMYESYLAQCNNAKSAVRQVCRKLDLYWNDAVYNRAEKKSTTRSVMLQYIIAINTVTYAGKSYDDSLASEGTLWSFAPEIDQSDIPIISTDSINGGQSAPDEVSPDVVAFWGSGYTPNMYRELEQRRAYWMSELPDGVNVDIGTQAIIRQICSLELDINRDRQAGKSIEKSVTALNTLLGSANLKPVQKQQENLDSSMANTPFGVWLYKWENKRPLPEIDENLKDVNKIRRYIFTWMGHLCKMLGLKNGYAKMYEDEVARLRVDKPEYDGDDDEAFMTELMIGGDES